MPAQDGTTWGNWTYNKKTLTLDFERPEARQYDYQVPLVECTSGSKILDWILQFSIKTWTTPEEVGYLIKALDAVAGSGLQGKVCPFGDNRDYDMKSFLGSN